MLTSASEVQEIEGLGQQTVFYGVVPEYSVVEADYKISCGHKMYTACRDRIKFLSQGL